jgi:homoserine acetyltransferase
VKCHDLKNELKGKIKKKERKIEQPEMQQSAEYDIFKLGDWELQSGGKLEDAHIVYKTFGDLSLPAIFYPTWYSGRMFANFVYRSSTDKESDFRQLLVDRERQNTQSKKVFHHYSRPIWKRTVIFTIKPK